MESEFKKADWGKARYDLLPPELLHETALVLDGGAQKYGENNWAQGADYSRYFAAMQRHAWQWWSGQNVDEESGMSHLAHVVACAGFLMAYQRRDLGNDDRPETELWDAR
jgi:hypothetical protein